MAANYSALQQCSRPRHASVSGCESVSSKRRKVFRPAALEQTNGHRCRALAPRHCSDISIVAGRYGLSLCSVMQTAYLRLNLSGRVLTNAIVIIVSPLIGLVLALLVMVALSSWWHCLGSRRGRIRSRPTGRFARCSSARRRCTRSVTAATVRRRPWASSRRCWLPMAAWRPVSRAALGGAAVPCRDSGRHLARRLADRPHQGIRPRP